MALIEVMPVPPDGLLDRQGSRVVIALASDLTPDGAFGEEWLIVTKTISASTQRQYSHAEDRLELTSITAAEIEGLVGGGALIISLGREKREVLRFSNAQQKKFARVAKYLQDWRNTAKT